MYIDGIEVESTSANEPKANNNDFIFGAMDQTSNPPNKPVNYFSGWIDEVRIWNKTLDPHHLRQMMNQQINNSGGSVIGEVVPMIIQGPDANKDGVDDDPLTWANLEGYYRMNQIDCGNLSAFEGGKEGKLRNISSKQEETAPLPYTTKDNGNWIDTTSNTPWTYGDTVWDYPNSIGIDGSTPIDWNIVQLSHDMNSGNKDITLLGLISDNTTKELTIEDPTGPYDETNVGKMLWITHYLKLDGKLDLVGESQLIQKRYDVNQTSGSVFANTSEGYAERDQQGTVNPFNYNDFSSPFAPNNATVNNENTSNTYGIGDVLRDGTTTVPNPTIDSPINWIADNTAEPGTPTQVSTRWLYAYYNALERKKMKTEMRERERESRESGEVSVE